MTQASEAGSAPRIAAALRFGAALTTAGPVLLAVSGLGRQTKEWFCSGPWIEPAAAQTAAWELTNWAGLLLPAVLAGLLLHGPRRSNAIALSAIGSVLALELWSAVVWPGTDLCTGEPLPIALPWTTIGCYLAAMVSLLLVARSPWPSGRHRTVLWAAAAAASAWWTATCRLPSIPQPTDRTLRVVYEPAGSVWDAALYWIWDAETAGLPLMVVVLAAAASAAAPGRAGRWAGAVAAGILLAIASADVAAIAATGHYVKALNPGLVGWHLVLAALLVVAAIRRRRLTVPRFDGLRSLWSRIPRRTRDLAGLIVIVVAAVWIVAATFMPLS
ncbi:hypothetical protein [Sphaerisporangium corydalis]|uniref:Copper resistance protein D domain-containing protein n=1 Tax=Sphaerisporangium corydalis TaxID=1441875 RepID=A0ABV9E8L9_9ACTN|nr:hypothetical protein [Sphaerisporangium corydalis]